jgi:uncharacterized protein YbbC (DUF1343 family)
MLMRCARVQPGIDVLEDIGFDRFRYEKLGLIINPSSVTSDIRSTLSIFLGKGAKIVALFGPEHGIRGEAQDQEECAGFMDEKCGAPIYSLYGKHLAPHRGMLKDVTTLIYDIQCIGSRYYTFKWTLFLIMHKAAQFEKKLIVLDRPNPINGVDLEGPMLQREFESFVGLFPIPIRHGMTIGELAQLFAAEFRFGVDLEVIKMKGWKRQFWFDETGLAWIAPSPNMPTLQTATAYPGMCLLEGTNLSEGRGTTKPFEYFGAPWLHQERVLAELKELPGCRLRPICFKPLWSKYCNTACMGFQLHVTDRSSFPAVKVALAIIRAIRKTHPDDFKWREPPYEFEEKKQPFDILIGNSEVRAMIDRGDAMPAIEKMCESQMESFRELRNRYLLYH